MKNAHRHDNKNVEMYVKDFNYNGMTAKISIHCASTLFIFIYNLIINSLKIALK